MGSIVTHLILCIYASKIVCMLKSLLKESKAVRSLCGVQVMSCSAAQLGPRRVHTQKCAHQ
jgi:hypothetical protein